MSLLNILRPRAVHPRLALALVLIVAASTRLPAEKKTAASAARASEIA